MRADAFILLKFISLTSPVYLHSHPQLSETLPQQQSAAELGRGGTKSKDITQSRTREIVFVIDTTKSMTEVLGAVKEGVSEFLARARTTTTAREYVSGSLLTGLLFYQDRKIGTECQLDYIVQWQVPLTENAGSETVSQTLAKLNGVRATTCGSDEEEEAVYDALERAILDPHWQDGSDRLLVLIGDAGPHPQDDVRKNPLRLDQATILELADRREVRILAVQINHDPYQDVSAFEGLATGRREDLKGRFVGVRRDPQSIRQALSRVLWADWNEKKTRMEKGKADKCRFVGINYYEDLGEICNRQIYPITDFKVGDVDVELGIGHGLTAESDRWFTKAMIGYTFPIPGQSGDASNDTSKSFSIANPFARVLPAAPALWSPGIR